MLLLFHFELYLNIWSKQIYSFICYDKNVCLKYFLFKVFCRFLQTACPKNMLMVTKVSYCFALSKTNVLGKVYIVYNKVYKVYIVYNKVYKVYIVYNKVYKVYIVYNKVYKVYIVPSAPLLDPFRNRNNTVCGYANRKKNIQDFQRSQVPFPIGILVHLNELQEGD